MLRAPAPQQVGPTAQIAGDLRERHPLVIREPYRFHLELPAEPPALLALPEHLVGALSPLSEVSEKLEEDHGSVSA